MTPKELLIFCFLAGAIIFWKVVGGRQYGKSEKEIRNEVATEFAERLKARVQRQGFPWEDNIIFESDIDGVAKEMGVKQWQELKK